MSIGTVVALIQQYAPGVSPSVIEQAVSDWLDDHPEATTTVEDGSITEEKLAAELAETLSNMGDDVTQLKSALNTVESGNLPLDIITDSYVKQNGDIANYPGWNRTDYVPCTPGKKLYVSNSVQTSYCYWYDAEKVKISPGGQLILAENLVNSPIVPPSGAYYFVVSNTAAGMASFSVRNLILYDEYVEQSNMIENVRNTSAQKEIINLFDKTNITENKYLSTSTGNLLNDSTSKHFASDFIYIGDLEKVIISGTHIVCWYDGSKTFVSCPENMNSGTNDITLTIPNGVKYLRFSAYKTSLNMAQIGKNVSRSNYSPYGYYTLPGLIVDGDAIIVDANGNGDYTSFTLAMKENYDNKKDVIVKPGTYNIVTEYTDIWGAEAVATMADADGEIFEGWQYGVKLNGRKISFQPGAKLVCDWTGHTVDGTHRFSALRVEMNVEIIGLDIDCTGTFYVIHDDYGNNQSDYTNIYRNCRVIGHSISNANCIGGGCKKYSRHIIENCYFDNGGLASSTTVRYHNTNSDGAVPELYISNSYFNGWVTPRYYGTQTTKMRAYINNCKAQKIAVIAESGSYTTENVDLFKWCNEEAE